MAKQKKRFFLVVLTGLLNLCTSARASVEDTEPEMPPYRQPENQGSTDWRPKTPPTKAAHK